ncbi:hypothetical protein [Mycolicibacterium chlorophenolicum]|uniref:Uncharacterized protein n=1 Tax=Mycolicibacterium chlorophenolicum TaxID=37916 RepID=A0A0J6VN84_9MYCO|nr:hypothetical protein [Mycolicibacterium chlorophenolicum]KMO70977.1 hypothetical protein MCHLDSM_05872 [Mycolicibacterium chlorophenolicum]
MGKRKRWGHSFARWYYGQGKGRQFALCFSLFSMIVLGLVLTAPLLKPEAKEVEVWCSPDGSFKVFLSPDDPRLQPVGPNGELGLGVSLCDLTMGPPTAESPAR